MVLRVLPLSGYCYLFFATSSGTLVDFFSGPIFYGTVLRVVLGMNAGWGLIRELSDHRIQCGDDFTKYFRVIRCFQIIPIFRAK